MPPEYLKLLLSHAECNVAYPMNRKSLQLVHIWVHNFYLCRTATRSTFICRLKKNFFSTARNAQKFSIAVYEERNYSPNGLGGCFSGIPCLARLPWYPSRIADIKSISASQNDNSRRGKLPVFDFHWLTIASSAARALYDSSSRNPNPLPFIAHWLGVDLLTWKRFLFLRVALYGGRKVSLSRAQGTKHSSEHL